MTKRSLALLLFVILISSIQSFAGKTYYVSLKGKDSNPGTKGSPWASLQHAIQTASAGDTVIMRGGVYQTDEVWMRGNRGMGGTKGQYLTIKNFPGEVPSVGGDRRMIVDAVDFLRIEGLHFRLPYRISGGGDGLQVVNNTFEGPQPKFAAIELFADNSLIEGNVIKISDDGGTQDHGIYLHAGHNNTLRNNFISGSSGYGIHLFDAVSSGGPRAAAGYDNILIEGNLIVGSRMRAGVIISPGEGVEVRNVRIRKNTIVKNSVSGLRISNNAHDIEIYNNTFYGNGWNAGGEEDGSTISLRETSLRKIFIKNNIIEMSKSGAYHIQNRDEADGVVAERNLYCGVRSPECDNVTDSKPLSADPLFKDPKNNDFHLQASSPAIDKGLDVGLPYNGSAPDLGAHEFGTTPAPARRADSSPKRLK